MCSKGIKNRARISGSITNCNLKECQEILLSHWSYKRKLQKKSTTIKQCSFLFHNFIQFSFGRAGSSLLGGVSLVAMLGFSVQWLLSCGARALGHAGFSRHGTWTQQSWVLGYRAQSQKLWHMGLVARQHMGLSWTRGQTYVSCIAGRFFTAEPPGKPNPVPISNKTDS